MLNYLLIIIIGKEKRRAESEKEDRKIMRVRKLIEFDASESDWRKYKLIYS